MVYLVTWDLNREKTGYAAARLRLIGRLEQYEHTKDSGLDSVWFLNANGSANDVFNDLQKYIDTNDCLIVTKMKSGEHQGWLSKATWDWISKRL